MTAENPDDAIWINLLCPAQNYRGVCRQMSCGRSAGGQCVLNGQAWVPVCAIPKSHPVTQFRLEMAAADPRAHGLPLS